MSQIATFFTTFVLALTFSSSFSLACGDWKAQQQTESAAAAMVSQKSGAVCSSTGKPCPSIPQQPSQFKDRQNNIQVIAVSSGQASLGCMSGTPNCNLSSVFAALSIGLFIVWGSVTLVGRLKI